MPSQKKPLKLNTYEEGLLIAAITKALSTDHDFTLDDVETLKELKSRIQVMAGLK